MAIVNFTKIEPFKGVDNFIFGESQSKIQEIFGESSEVKINNIMKNMRELREGKALVYKKEGKDFKLDHIICFKDMRPFIGDLDIFEVGLDPLKNMDPKYIEGDQYITFPSIGVCIGGLGKKKIPEKRILIAFRKKSLEHFKEYPFV